MVGGHSGDPSRATPREVAFIWPGGTEALSIMAKPVEGTALPGSKTRPRLFQGIITMEHGATEPCRIRVAPVEFLR